MKGPWANPKTGILYYRKATPTDLLGERERLAELGIEVTREVQRSLGTKDQKQAEVEYTKVSAQVEAQWEGWRSLLRVGFTSLSKKQRDGLAADAARAFFARHQENPADSPPRLHLPPIDAGDRERSRRLQASMSQTDMEALVRDGRKYLEATGKEQTELGMNLLRDHPAYAASLFEGLTVNLEHIYGADTNDALQAHNLHVDGKTRRLLNWDMAVFMAAARERLKAIEGYDYGVSPRLANAPTFEMQELAGRDTLSLFALVDHRARTSTIRPKTLADTRRYIQKFVEFIGHDDARRVRREDVRAWRDSLIDQTHPALSPKTIQDRYLSAVKATLAHGEKEFSLPSNVASGIGDGRERTQPTRSKGWDAGEALQILNATFRGTSKGLSLPHRRAIFWVPWISAYTGLRAAEITQFQGRHLKFVDEVPHLIISPADGSTKSGRAWAVGVHRHLIDLGLLDLIEGVGSGPLFYEAYAAGTDVTKVEGRPRAIDAYKRVADWVRDEVGLEAPLGRPNHAWRHLFTTNSRACRMDKEARDFMMGSRSATDAREGYGDWPPSVLNAEINKLPRFDVTDTGYRPA